MAHPIHTMLVHFPIAFWTGSTLSDLVYALQITDAWWRMGNALLAGGVASAVFAMVAGLMDLSKIDEDSAAMQVAYKHICLVILAWLLYAVSLYVRLDHAALLPPNTLATVASIFGFLVLSLGGWFGGQLVYGHGVGIRE